MPASRYLKVVLIGDEQSGKVKLLHTYTRLPLPLTYAPTVWSQFSSDISIDDNSNYAITTLLPPMSIDTINQQQHQQQRSLNGKKQSQHIQQEKCIGQRHLQAFWNTPNELYDDTAVAVREYSCSAHASCIIVMFNIQSIASFGHAKHGFIPELKHSENSILHHIPILLVGTHCEFRDVSHATRVLYGSQIIENSVDIAGEQQFVFDEFAGVTADNSSLVPYEQAAAYADSIGATYIECSNRTEHNVTHVFHTALLLAVNHQLTAEGRQNITIPQAATLSAAAQAFQLSSQQQTKGHKSAQSAAATAASTDRSSTASSKTASTTAAGSVHQQQSSNGKLQPTTTTRGIVSTKGNDDGCCVVS